ncbi:MAG: fibronectin type III domain-containing protein [Chloroflexi bacterium]|nr:fibronectin type III domain-containing protein [Chloroflexota bacterium]OJV91100.1 MAG: hypothetical protein BGO39_26265 [Chloroflexi bacterium 54-19]
MQLKKKHPFKFGFTANSRRLVVPALLSLAFSYLFLIAGPLGGPPLAASSLNADLPKPSNITVEEDDNNAILTWGGPLTPDNSNPDNVAGYRISVTPVGSTAAPAIQLTSYRTIQIQPLVNGQQYQAQVQAVDNMGNLSAPSDPVTFTGNPARVNDLRSRMTGFFDDFDLPAGPIDELKWNQAYSACNDPSMSSSFINNQFHTHNMELSGDCDRAQVINRPRATFDFTGRTGIITFDMDGFTNRSIWYLDLIDKADGVTDINSHISETGAGTGTPGNVLRIRQNGNGIDLQYVNATGTLTTLASTGSDQFPTLEWLGMPTVPNVRRHWEIHISQQKVEIYVGGKLVLASPLDLPFSQATVHWNAFSYNTAKNNIPYALLHWDNFGFDGPAPTIETHNYVTPAYAGNDFLEAVDNTPADTQITIPDSLDGAIAQRLMFTMQMRGYSEYKWDPGDKVIVNGQPISVPKPKIASDVQGSGISNIEPYSVTLDLPPGLLKTGENQLSFVMLSSGVLNIHAELDFPKGSAPAYTQPSAVYANRKAAVMVAMPDVGPGVYIDKLGDTDATDGGRYITNLFPVSGVVGVAFAINNDLALKATGKNPGISKVQIRLNQTPIAEIDPQDVPSFQDVYQFDTTKYANGEYDLDVVAFTPSGAVSIPDYFEAHAKAGDYYPVKIKINNSTSGLIAVPSTPVATAGAAATPAGSHAGMVMPGDATSGQTASTKATPAATSAGNTSATVSPSGQTTGVTLSQSARIGILLIFTYLVIGIALSLASGGKRVRSITKVFNIFFWPLRLLRINFN